MQRYPKPLLLLIDDVGYLPIDKLGADLLFQMISTRYERGAIVLSTNRAYKKWPEIFNNDSTVNIEYDKGRYHSQGREGPRVAGSDSDQTDCFSANA
jgi:DNA replication protein DnaC